jgi:hypothetical protein
MSTTATRLFLGFVAGFLSHLIFQGAFGSILYAAHLVPSLPWDVTPVPPLGIPKTLSLGFWAGLWGLTYVLLERRLTAHLSWWLGGLVFGLALPLMVHWFVVLPLKGFGVGGGFHLARMPIEVGFHAVFGIGTAIIYRIGIVTGRRVGTSSVGNVNVEGEHSERRR